MNRKGEMMMELIELEMKNFRQYLGQSKIVFAQGNLNTTVILGENGKGKTGIYRAMMFALYGLKQIQQDDPREEVRLVNRLLIESDGTAESTAKVKFEHEKMIYLIERTVRGVLVNSRYIEEVTSIKLSSIDQEGNYSIMSTEGIEVDAFMEGILGSQIKDFFIFDGEKIDTLVKTDDLVKKEVKTAIQKLLQLDDLEKSLSYLTSLDQTLRSEISKKSVNVKIGEINELIENNEIELKKKHQEKESYEIELRDARKITSELNDSLEKNSKTAIMMQKLRSKEKELSLIKENLDSKKTDIISGCIDDISSIFLNDTYTSVDNILGQASFDVSLSIPPHILEQSLLSETCICCGTSINSSSSEEIRIISNLKRINESGFESIYSDVRGFIKTDQSEINSKQSKIRKNAQSLYQFENQISEVSMAIGKYKESLGNNISSIIDIDETKISYEKSIGAISNAESRLKIVQKDIDANLLRKEELKRNMDEEIEKDSIIIGLQNEKQFVENLKNKLNIISTDFNDDIRDILNTRTTNLFKKMIDSKDSELIKEVRINDKFELELIGRDNEIINQDISQGQRHIMSLSFIMALANVAGGENNVAAFPFFMDSPFNRLSGNNRDNIIKIIPTLVNQWILLLTDTELTVSEESVLKNTNRLGKFYVINQIEPFHAEVEEKQTDKVISKRGQI